MNKEIEVKTKTFKKLEEERVELVKKITELVKIKMDVNKNEYEKRRLSQWDTNIMDQEIENAKLTLQICQDDLANKEKMRDDAATKQLFDGQQTFGKMNKINQEIGSLKRKMFKISKEQDDLPKKQKVNRDLVEHISNMIDAKIKDLVCPVCFETAEGLIYQCTQGHLICQGCLPSLKICPECRTKYPKSPFRNRQVNCH